jgi:hypothetical protein
MWRDFDGCADGAACVVGVPLGAPGNRRFATSISTRDRTRPQRSGVSDGRRSGATDHARAPASTSIGRAEAVSAVTRGNWSPTGPPTSSAPRTTASGPRAASRHHAALASKPVVSPRAASQHKRLGWMGRMAGTALLSGPDASERRFWIQQAVSAALGETCVDWMVTREWPTAV